MASTAKLTTADLRVALTTAEIEAAQLLRSDGDHTLDAVVWISAHLAAMERAIYPLVRRRVPDGREVVARQRAVGDRLMRVLRVAERRHSGDVLASGLSAARVSTLMSDLLEEHVSVEDELIHALDAELSQSEQLTVIGAYADALEHAPTRPHPHLHRGALMFRLDAFRDRVLDAMDGRHVPVPRLERHPVTPGRWGLYWLGRQEEEN